MRICREGSEIVVRMDTSKASKSITRQGREFLEGTGHSQEVYIDGNVYYVNASLTRKASQASKAGLRDGDAIDIE